MTLRSCLLATTALMVLASPALADDAAIEKRLDAMQRMIDTQARQIQVQKNEISSLKKVLGQTDAKPAPAPVASAPKPEIAAAPPPALENKVTAQQAQIEQLSARLETAQNDARLAKLDTPVWSFAAGRPTLTSPDGRFTFAVRAIAQYDTALYTQGGSAVQLAAANGPDLSSGANFRRAQLGITGKLFNDWSYYFNYDFAGSGGTETPGHIQQAWVQYDGLAPFALRVGAFTPSANLEDNTGAADTIFLERNAPSEISRSVAGGDGRDAIGIIYTGDRVYGALTYTGNKVQDSGSFDEQQALVGRLSYLALADDNTKVVISASGTHVFRIADTAAGNFAPRTITLSAPPELTVDNTGAKLVSSGAINAESVWLWGLESGVQYQNLYAQAGYFDYGVDLRGTPGAYGFKGWYAQASWVLTGESRVYSTTSGAFTNPKPRIPFSLSGGGLGAWEAAVRFSDLDLNDNAGSLGAALPAGGIRGGDQRIWTAGLNWYPNTALKFQVQYQHIDISRIGTIPAGFGHGVLNNTQVGQTLDTVALRTQIAF